MSKYGKQNLTPPNQTQHIASEMGAAAFVWEDRIVNYFIKQIWFLLWKQK